MRMKILIAEDDLMIVDMAEHILVTHGYDVCGIGRTVDEAVDLGRRHKPDLALLDLRLEGGLGTEVAAQLGLLGRLGVLYASGNTAQIVLTARDGDACLAKPYGPADLIRSLQIVRDILAIRAPMPPFPRGFQLLRPALTASCGVPLG